MIDKEVLLQDSLQKIEAGVPAEIVLARMPAASEEDAELLRLAVVLRSLPHPEPSPATRKAARALVVKPAVPQKAPVLRLPRLEIPFLRLGLAALAVIFLAVLGTGVYLAGPQDARAAALIDINGLVETTSGGETLAAAANGSLVHAGQRIVTDASSSVTLVYFDGSRTVIGPKSSVTLERLNGNWGGGLNLLLNQEVGSTDNLVASQPGLGNHFSVQTPSGAASARGTHFSVQVEPDGEARYVVTNGVVNVSQDQDQADLQPGQALVLKPGQAFQPVAYAFRLQGLLESVPGDENHWKVEGIPFSITGQTFVQGSLQAGMVVDVLGRIQADGAWAADSVNPATDVTPVAMFAGRVESLAPGAWVISGQKVRVDDQAQSGAPIQPQDVVNVSLSASSQGQLMAERVTLLQSAQKQPASLQLGFEPSGQEEKSCAEASQAQAVLINRSTQGRAEGVELSYVIEQGVEYASQISVAPQTIEALEPGESAAVVIRVQFSPAWIAAHQGSKLKLRIFASHSQTAHLNLVFSKNCAAGTTSEASPSPAATQTSTPENQGAPQNGQRCETQPNPAAANLAAAYGVPVEEITSWFCKGFGLGEIDLAYNLARTVHASPDTIFALRKSGASWGEIKKQLSSSGPKNNPPKNKP